MAFTPPVRPRAVAVAAQRGRRVFSPNKSRLRCRRVPVPHGPCLTSGGVCPPHPHVLRHIPVSALDVFVPRCARPGGLRPERAACCCLETANEYKELPRGRSRVRLCRVPFPAVYRWGTDAAGTASIFPGGMISFPNFGLFRCYSIASSWEKFGGGWRSRCRGLGEARAGGGRRIRARALPSWLVACALQGGASLVGAVGVNADGPAPQCTTRALVPGVW